MLSITSMFIHHPLPSIFPCSCAVPLGVRRHVGPRGQGLGPHGRGPLVIEVHDLTTPLSAIPPLAVGLKSRLKTSHGCRGPPSRGPSPPPSASPPCRARRARTRTPRCVEAQRPHRQGREDIETSSRKPTCKLVLLALGPLGACRTAFERWKTAPPAYRSGRYAVWHRAHSSRWRLGRLGTAASDPHRPPLPPETAGNH